jgi:hypothetical protein
MHLDMHLPDGSTIRFMGNESLACRPFLDPAERDDSRHVGTLC